MIRAQLQIICKQWEVPALVHVAFHGSSLLQSKKRKACKEGTQGSSVGQWLREPALSLATHLVLPLPCDFGEIDSSSLSSVFSFWNMHKYLIVHDT